MNRDVKLKSQQVRIVAEPKGPDHTMYMDFVVFAEADFFIGNCISSFTGLSVRERAVGGKPSGFYGRPARYDGLDLLPQPGPDARR